jgi:uncharacterized LabA/DUF88 family protein
MPPAPGREDVAINQTVAILIDGNNIERSVQNVYNNPGIMIDFDTLIPRLVGGRSLNRLKYFREGRSISDKLAGRLHGRYYGTVVPCHKSADIPLTIHATQIADKVDCIVICSGDADYVELIRHLKSRGVRVEIAAVPATTAELLLKEADYFYPIEREDCYEMRSGGRW